MACKKCGSHAINLGQNGRDDDRPDLCDVCYWRTRVAKLEEALILIRDNDWVENALDPQWAASVARRVLEEK